MTKNEKKSFSALKPKIRVFLMDTLDTFLQIVEKQIVKLFEVSIIVRFVSKIVHFCPFLGCKCPAVSIKNEERIKILTKINI